MITKRNTVNYSFEVTNKYIELCQCGNIMYDDEVKLLTYLSNKYKPVTISEYCKLRNKHYKVIQRQYHENKIAGQNIGNVDFIYLNLN